MKYRYGESPSAVLMVRETGTKTYHFLGAFSFYYPWVDTKIEEALKTDYESAWMLYFDRNGEWEYSAPVF